MCLVGKPVERSQETGNHVPDSKHSRLKVARESRQANARTCFEAKARAGKSPPPKRETMGHEACLLRAKGALQLRLGEGLQPVRWMDLVTCLEAIRQRRLCRAQRMP